jgi:hypothetical protein
MRRDIPFDAEFPFLQMACLVWVSQLRTTCRLIYSSHLTAQFMKSHVNISISLFHRTLSYIEKTNIYKNEIILNMLSASKLIDKKPCHTITFVFYIFYQRKDVRTNFFLPLWSSLKALQNLSLRHFIWTATFVGNHGLRTNTSNLGFFYVTLLRDQKNFSETPELEGNYSFS